MSQKRGRWHHLDQVKVAEEFKIAVALAIKKLQFSDDHKEFEFPSSLTAEERKYAHIVSQQNGFKSKSRGKGSSRCLTVYKKEGSTIMSLEAVMDLADVTQGSVMALLQRCPVTNKERQDLLPATERDRLMNPELRDLSMLRSLGRLTPGPPQVPVVAGLSEFTDEARKLPIWGMQEQILAAIHHNQVVLICGETGSGKTTQVPQMVLQEASSMGKPCRVFCTQPRRISALTIAERVAAERAEKVGYTVGYQIRLESKLSPKTLLTFCTNGVLLRTLMGGDSALASVTHIFVDEVHERDRFTDFLLMVLRDCLPKFRHLKLVLMSAALDVSLYAKYFNNCPVVDVPGQCYPVREHFLEDVLNFTNYSTPAMQSARKELLSRPANNGTTLEWTEKMKMASREGGTGGGIKEDKGSLLLKSITGSSDNSRKASTTSAMEHSLKEDMDAAIEDAFLSGSDEAFSQMLYLIMSEDVSPDYQHSLTWATALMVASGRGRIDVMEQLFTLGSSLTLRAANNWSALDWAQNTSQQEAVDLLQAYSACEGIDLLAVKSDEEVGKTDGSSPKSDDIVDDIKMDKITLDAYQHSVSEERTDIDLIFALCLKIHNSEPPGSILVFLPGYDDIVTLRYRVAAEEKEFLQAGKYCLFCLHSSMQSTDQKRVFRPAPPGYRKIILSTNIAETSVTIKDVVYVVDSGKVKEMSYDALTNVSSLRSVWISQASSIQRKGRAGRCQPGICYHLFSRVRYPTLRMYQTPEILRTPLQELCLHTKLLAPTNVPIADFLSKAPEPPSFMVIRNAVTLLKNMDALDGWEDVTELGHHLLDLPLPPRLAKMVIIATILKCLDPVLTIAASLAYKDPFILPANPSEKQNAVSIRRKFATQTFSDHMVLLRAFQAWQKACADGWERNWCENNYVSGATMEMVHGMRAQVLAQLRGAGFVRARGPGDIRDVNSNSDNWAVVKAALVAGTYPNLIRVDREQNQLRTQKESRVRLYPSSCLLEGGGKDPKGGGQQKMVSMLASDWLVYDEMVRIGVMAHVRTVSLVTPITVLLLAGPTRLPLDALSDPSSRCSGDVSSDSESEDRPSGVNCLVRLDSWIQFIGNPQSAHLALQLRYKLHSLILRRLRAPNKPLTQADEDIVRAVSVVLSQEEQHLGLMQPAGVGQRPRPILSHANPLGFDKLDEDFPSEKTTERQGSWSEDCPSERSDSRRASDGSSATGTIVSHHVEESPIEISSEAARRGSSGSSTSLHQTEVCKRESQDSELANGEDTESDTYGSCDSVASSNRSGKSRYFLAKAQMYKQIEASFHTGLWALSDSVEKRILQAAQCGTVFLIFMVHRGANFHGFARFCGERSDEKCADVSAGVHSPFTMHRVDWVKHWNLSFHLTRHLHNAMSNHAHIYMGRDGQEIDPLSAEKLLRLWDSVENSGSFKSGTPPNSYPPMGGPMMMHDGPPPPPPRHPFHSPPFGPPMMNFPHRPFRNFGGGGGNEFGGFRPPPPGSGSGFRGGFRRQSDW